MNSARRFTTRRARPADAGGIAAAHIDSIQAIGPDFYSPSVVENWSSGLSAPMYLKAMERGEVFFVAVDEFGDDSNVLGFATHRVDGNKHGTAVYVRGVAARRGIGSALFRLAEADAVASGAQRIEIEASLAAVDFYKANGFREIGPGEFRLRSGALMACVFMSKELT